MYFKNLLAFNFLIKLFLLCFFIIILIFVSYSINISFSSRDQSMVESGVTEGWKNTASFLFRTKPQAKNDLQSYPRRETAASAGKRCR